MAQLEHRGEHLFRTNKGTRHALSEAAVADWREGKGRRKTRNRNPTRRADVLGPKFVLVRPIQGHKSNMVVLEQHSDRADELTKSGLSIGPSPCRRRCW